MKLLLTSNGLSNPTIVNALKKWVDKPHFAFIPTAANATGNHKAWLVTNYVECASLGHLDIVDISAMDKSMWLPRLQKANVIVMGGGVASHLMNHIISSGLIDELPELLKTRVYVGISAGNIVLSKRIQVSAEYLLSSESKEALKGIGYVDFNIRPHFMSSDRPEITDEFLREASNKITGDLYALDNESAIVYEDGKITVISEGDWKLYSKK
ncbi:MAG: Type 1 glutamine amidotransferase-like domain-containing protein [Candidatus Nanoarchaeia archaeon]